MPHFTVGPFTGTQAVGMFILIFVLGAASYSLLAHCW